MTGRRRVVEAGLVLSLGGAMVVEMAVTDKPGVEVTPLALLTVVAATAPVLLRHRHPGLALAGSMAALVAVTSVSGIYLTIPYPSVVSAYALAVAGGLRRAVVAGLLTAPAVLAIIALKSPHGLLDWETPKNLALVALPLVLGVAEHNRRRVHEEETRGRVGDERLRIARDVHDVVAHAMVAINVQAGVGAHLLDRETPKNLALVALPLVLGVSEHNRRRVHEEETRGRVGDERLRIARDVHDVVAHAMVAINVQAGVGAHLLDRDPEQARSTLLDIKRTSGEALADLRSTLGVLRRPEDADTAPVAPTLSLRELPELRASLDAAGLRLDLDLDPAAASLPAAVDATAYRIVREALTNVLRHAGSDEARVEVRREADRVVIEVEDDGAARRTPVNGQAPGTGHGLRGMRERALAAGGTLEAGPREQGGWRVAAWLPAGPP